MNYTMRKLPNIVFSYVFRIDAKNDRATKQTILDDFKRIIEQFQKQLTVDRI